MKADAPVPFIVWTMRRTGATTLAKGLFALSPLDELEHEPFNTDRTCGGITRTWLEREDEAALYDALARICERKPLIKHCLEMVPPALNRALAQVSSHAEYRHVFLYRRSPLNRLLSLEFAQRSGIWYREQQTVDHLDNAVFTRPLPIEEMVAHETACRETARDVYLELRRLGQTPVLLAYEDIFLGKDTKRTRGQLQAALEELRLSRGQSEDDQFIEQLVTSGHQGTRDQYARFTDYRKLKSALAPLGPFELREAEAFWSQGQALRDGN